MKVNVMETSTNEVMDYRGLSMYLKLSQGTLRHWVMHGKIPFYKIGSSVLFAKKHIDVWLEEHHQGLRRTRAGDGVDSGGELFPATGGSE